MMMGLETTGVMSSLGLGTLYTILTSGLRLTHNLRKGYLKYLYLYSALADTYLNLEDFPISFILTKF